MHIMKYLENFTGGIRIDFQDIVFPDLPLPLVVLETTSFHAVFKERKSVALFPIGIACQDIFGRSSEGRSNAHNCRVICSLCELGGT
jgi:hypothetical protein